MNKIKLMIFRNINLFLAIVISFSLLLGCNKKNDSTTSDNKTSPKDENISPDKPFHVVFDISGITKGTVDAYYNGKKSKSTSSLDIAGQKMNATAYFDGDTKMMYIVNEIAGMRMGIKMDSKAYSEQSDKGQVDVNTFRDKIKEMDKIGTEEILGRKCDIYRSKDSSYSVSMYKESIPLKFSSGSGKTVMVASKLETDITVTDEMFKPPQDVKYQDATEMMKDMKDKKNMKSLEDKTKEMEDVMKKYNK
jgi:hypothetical protein